MRAMRKISIQIFHRQKLSSLPVVMMFRFEIRPVRVLRALGFQYRARPFPWCCPLPSPPSPALVREPVSIFIRH
jgi:hypothetical protein